MVDFYSNVISPTLVLSIESAGNFIKYPNNYANDRTNTLANSSDYFWFYSSLIEDVNNTDLGIKSGNYLSLFFKTNNGDNDDYFRSVKKTMAYTWSIGHKDFESLSLNATTQSSVQTILSNNLDLGIYAIEKAGEQINVRIKDFNVCIPQIEKCNGYEPDDGVWRFHARFEILNSGIRDLTEESEITLSLSNPKMSFHSHRYENSTSSSGRRNLSTSNLSFTKSMFASKEEEKVTFEGLISYKSSGDPLKDSESLGKVSVSLTYYDTTINVKDIDFSSYSTYKATLNKYYDSGVNVWAILFSIWFFFHALFLFLQIRYDITKIIKEKLQKHKEDQKNASIVMTKEDHAISEMVVNEIQMTSVNKSLKDSLTVSRSNTELLPKLLTNDVSSIRSSKDKEIFKESQKEEDSEEI